MSERKRHNPYHRYEQEKRRLQHLPPAEYEQAIRELARKLRV